MIDFSVRVFTFSSSNCIFFCSHTCILLLVLCSVFGPDHVSPLMITECITLEVIRDLLFPCLEVQITDRVHVPRDWHEKKRRADYMSSPWTRPLSLYSFLHFRRFSFGHSSRPTLWPSVRCCDQTSQVLQLCPERDVSLFVFVTAIHVRRTVFDFLNPGSRVTACCRIQHSVTRTWCSINVILVNTALLFRRVIYRHIVFRETNIELPNYSSVDWDRHAPQLWTIYGVHWFSWVKIEISIRRVNNTQLVMMRLRRQNHKTKIRRT